MRSDLAVRECVYPAGLRLARHVHDYSNVTVITGGSIDEVTETGGHHGSPFSVVFKPRGVEHENRVGRDGARTLSIQLRGDVDGHAWAWFEEPSVVRAALALARSTAVDIEARAVALLAEVLVGRASARPPSPPWLQEITRTLQSRFDEPLRFDALAREIGLHPVYLSRAFQRYTGQTMQECVRALRLCHARQLLSTSVRTVSSIAADSGFADSSHLTRTFSRSLGITPNAFRGLARSSA
jgi:AraC family transcriptional regulator